jgi:hypothetical protein
MSLTLYVYVRHAAEADCEGTIGVPAKRARHRTVTD